MRGRGPQVDKVKNPPLPPKKTIMLFRGNPKFQVMILPVPEAFLWPCLPWL